MSEKVYAVFDCNIYIQSLLNEKSVAKKCVDLARSGQITALISLETFAELEDVIKRPFIISRLRNATPERLQAFLEDIKANSVLVRRVPKVFQLERDPKDERYVNLAVEAEADYIVSRDKDLLDLMTGHTDECKEFRRRFRPLKVIDPVEFLRIVETA